LDAKKCLRIQKISGSRLYYARGVDPMVFMPLNEIETEKNKSNIKNAGSHISIIGLPGDASGYHNSEPCVRHDTPHSQ
jgi:hypothetical protein